MKQPGLISTRVYPSKYHAKEISDADGHRMML